MAFLLTLAVFLLSTKRIKVVASLDHTSHNMLWALIEVQVYMVSANTTLSLAVQWNPHIMILDITIYSWYNDK